MSTAKELYATYTARANAAKVEVVPMHKLRNKAGIEAAIAALPAPKSKGRKRTEGTVSLADIARSVNVNEKVARAKFRRLDAKGELKGFTIKRRWEFDAADQDEVANLLTAGN